jgi:hypothetical protein
MFQLQGTLCEGNIESIQATVTTGTPEESLREPIWPIVLRHHTEQCLDSTI